MSTLLNTVNLFTSTLISYISLRTIPQLNSRSWKTSSTMLPLNKVDSSQEFALFNLTMITAPTSVNPHGHSWTSITCKLSEDYSSTLCSFNSWWTAMSTINTQIFLICSSMKVSGVSSSPWFIFYFLCMPVITHTTHTQLKTGTNGLLSLVKLLLDSISVLSHASG